MPESSDPPEPLERPRKGGRSRTTPPKLSGVIPVGKMKVEMRTQESAAEVQGRLKLEVENAVHERRIE